MDRSTAILITLVTYKIVLVLIGLWASKRTQSAEDFFLGGRGLGPWVAGISSSASASSAWSLLGASGATYLWGVSMLWLFPAIITGYVFNWLWLAPRLRTLSNQQQAITLTEIFANSAGKFRQPVQWVSSFIIVFSFSFYIASQFQAAGSTFASTFDIDMHSAIILGSAIILVYTLLGGFWAVSITDTIQGILMAIAAVILPCYALIDVGGFSGLFQGLQIHSSPQQLSFTGGHSGIVAVGFILGIFGVGLGNPGQPHVVNRFMAIKDEKSLKQAKIIGIVWPILVFGGMLLLGLCARVLLSESGQNDNNSEQVLFVMTNALFSPVVAGIIIAAVLSAIMSTADSQLLVSASSLSYDLKKQQSPRRALIVSRITVAIVTIISTLLAIYAPATIFERVLFAWAALGSAFGPLLIVRLMGNDVKPLFCLLSIVSGFIITVFLNWQPSPPGDYLERLAPFIIAFMLAWFGRVKHY